jgi:predicted RNA-binding protein YlqC (UPF0109 family)
MAQSLAEGIGDRDSRADEIHALVLNIVCALVDNPEGVSVEALKSEFATRFVVQTAPEDRGKVIGKQGRMAQSIRILLGAISVKMGHQFTLQLVEPEGPGKVPGESRRGGPLGRLR